MRVLVTGATGFAGRWLTRELAAAGHEPLLMPPSADLDITDEWSVNVFVAAAAPDAIAHLAGMAFGPDAWREPERAQLINAGGTKAILAAAPPGVPVLVVSSAEVYGSPGLADLPLAETAALGTDQPYGQSKLAQEHVARAAAESGQPVTIVRPFNHAGPGQRPEFVIPSLARRILAARFAGTMEIVAGNVDVRRDFTDVRDVVRAYRLLLEAMISGPLPRPTYNVASGRSVAIREIAASFARLAAIEVEIRIDPTLVRASDPPEIRGDASAIAADLGWSPNIPFEATLRDVFDEADRAIVEGDRTSST